MHGRVVKPLFFISAITVVQSRYYQGHPSSHQVPNNYHQQKYPHNPFHFTPNYFPNGNPEKTPETHVFYDRKNVPYFATTENETGRVGGDRAVEPWEAPYQIQLRGASGHFCGGTLVISPSTKKQIIITAAHCFFNQNDMTPLKKEGITLRAGNIKRDGEQGQFRKVKEYINHPDSMYDQYHNMIQDDVTIIFPDREFELAWLVKPMQLPYQGQPILAKYVTVTGWGIGREEGNESSTASMLRTLDLPVIDHKTCQMKYEGYHGHPGKKLISDKHFCAGFMQGGKDTCWGDSGGPTIAQENGRSYLSGVVSWGHGCAKAGYSGVYVSTASYIDWISKTSYDFQVRGIKPAEGGKKLRMN